MKIQRLTLVAAALCALAPASFAAPKASKTPAKAVKVTTLHYCAMTGEKLGSMGKPVGATTYKNYKISFCCAGCPDEFKKLTAKEKDAKIAGIVKKQAAEKKA